MKKNFNKESKNKIPMDWGKTLRTAIIVIGVLLLVPMIITLIITVGGFKAIMNNPATNPVETIRLFMNLIGI